MYLCYSEKIFILREINLNNGRRVVLVCEHGAFLRRHKSYDVIYLPVYMYDNTVTN